MDTLKSLQTLVRVVELGSFSAAARESNVSQPTISKIIAALEQQLGVRLLERTTTSMILTEEGKKFYVRSKSLIEEYGEAVDEAQGQTQQLTGLLRINAPVGLGELHLQGLLLEFLSAYPQIEIDLVLNDRPIDLVEEGVDVAIRLGTKLPPNVIARNIAKSRRVVVASPSYEKRAPKIHHPDDLATHEYIRFTGTGTVNQLVFEKDGASISVSSKGRFCVNSSVALRQSILGGAGFGTAPAWLVQDLIDNGSLVRLLPSWDMASQHLHLVYPTRRYQPLRTKALLEFMIKRISQLPGFQSMKS